MESGSGRSFLSTSSANEAARPIGPGRIRLLARTTLTVPNCLKRLFSILLLASAFGLALAGNGNLNLSAFPAVALADGRSTITITAEVRDDSGNLVPDGTQVVFDTSLGTFRDRAVRTQNGFARATLVASSTPGMGKVRATALAYNAVRDLEVDFVADKSLLSGSTEYIELVSKNALQYSIQHGTLTASSPNRGVVLQFRDVQIECDDVQVVVQRYEVKARHAKLTIGKVTNEYEDLFFRLNYKKGFGTGTIEVTRPVIKTNGAIAIPTGSVTKSIFGVVDITQNSAVEHVGDFDRRYFQFVDLSSSISTVDAKKAVAYPAKEIQFHKASIKVGGMTVMSLPLYQISASDTNPIITDQFLSVSNNQVAVNYPYYLGLAPGSTSLLRFRYGNRYGAGAGAAGGTYVDYELNWGHLFGGEGGFVFSGLARKDWGVGLRQAWNFDGRSTITAQVDLPAHQSLFSTISASKPFEGFNANFTANAGRSLAGTPYNSSGFSFIMEKDPIRIGQSPVNMYLGISSTQTKISGGGTSQSDQTTGISARLVTNPLRLDRHSTLNGSYKVTQGFGSGGGSGLSQLATVSVGTVLQSGWAFSTTYEFQQDSFSSLLGQHRLSAESYFSQGKFSFSTSIQKTLDVDRLSGRSTIRYKLSPIWRLNYAYYLDRYGSESFLDQVFILGFKLGYREVGLSYSTQTRRLGFELLGTSFD